MANVKNNLRATAWPQVTDDTSQGYSKGSTWWFEGILFVCDDETTGAAKWTPIQGNMDALQPNTFVKPANFGGFAAAALIGNTDLFAAVPFVITRDIDAVGVHVTVAGTTGDSSTRAQVVFGLYPTDPVTGKPDGQARVGGSLTTLDLSATGDRIGTFTSGRVITERGLYWLGCHFKNVATMPTVIPMVGNGRHIHRGDLSDLSGGAPFRAYAVTAAYTGSAPATCPTTGTSTAVFALPSLRIKA